MIKHVPFDPRGSIKRHLLAGLTLAGLLVFGLGGWAATTELSGAVIASGQLVVDSDMKKVQHPTGGVVAELLVREGDLVKAGDLLIRLDDTKTKANLAIVSKTLDELLARQARDEAERDGAVSVTFPESLLARADDPAVARLIAGEKKLFDIEQSARAGKKAQLTARVAQLNEQINGLNEQIASKNKEIDLIRRELDGVRDLWRKNLVQIDRLINLERDAARVDGELGQLTASIAETRGKVHETELQILQIDQDLGTEVGKDLGEVRGKIAELSERKVAAEDDLKRIDIRAPQTGFVHQLTVHTIGGVIAPQGDPIMLIVPSSDELRVEAKIQPYDIDQVHLGQKATLRFTALNMRTTPELNGEVSLVSANVTQDTKTGANYYTVRITVPAAEIARLGDVRLVPGMPVEAFIQTTPRTAIAYLVRPIRDQITRAFREK
ncbi:MAG: HlyD family type I secretion periplasmic adaptor subunit, partial [Methylobacteriaceae bacterium]|nr:HlyD family type I secretion periplasmic adaptor subunit [Methylobacteriaceae bacterium]